MKWEYKTINIMPPLKFTSRGLEKALMPLLDEELSIAGKEGWELVTVAPYDMGTKFVLFSRDLKKNKKSMKINL